MPPVLVLLICGLIYRTECLPLVDDRNYDLFDRPANAPPPVVFNPVFSVLMFRILVATNPYGLGKAVAAYSSLRPPIVYNGLSETRYLPQFGTLGVYGYSTVDTVRDSQPFGISGRIQELV